MADETITQLTEYITKDNDRWDLIAYKATGDPMRMSEIMELNADVPLDPILPAGLKLFVPIIEEESINENLLPPWMRP